jgi:hypothetical protein
MHGGVGEANEWRGERCGYAVMFAMGSDVDSI